MPRQNLNFDGKIRGRKSRVRKRGCSSSSSSSLQKNYRLKRVFLVGKRGPVPVWKMMSPKSESLENDKGYKYLTATAKDGGEKPKELSVSARKLAASLLEINGLPSSKLKRENPDEDKTSELGHVVRKERFMESSSTLKLHLSDRFHDSPVSERMDPPKSGIHIRRASAGSQKLLQVDNDLGGVNSLQNCLVEVDPIPNDARSPCRQVVGAKNRLKDVYNSLTTSKELLKVMSRICRLEHQNSTSVSLISALKFELDRACIHVHKLIQEQKVNRSEIDILLKRFEEEKVLWKIKEQERIHSAITSRAGELEIEKKLRRQTERLNKKLGKELAETKESLSNVKKELEAEKRSREILEQACDELARGIGDDRAEVEELKRQSEKVLEEVEKEREMLQLADVLREERVQMKLSEAKYQFEEKNALVDKLRNELEAYLKCKTAKEQGDVSPSYDKIKELEQYLKETLPVSYQYKDQEREDIGENNEDEEDGDDSADSDLHSIELNMDDISKSFQWNDAVKNDSKRNSVDRVRGRKSMEKIKKPLISLETKFTDGIEWDFTTNKQGHLNLFDGRGFEITSHTLKHDAEDEIERYNMIKDLREHIVSASRIVPSQDLDSPKQKFSQKNVAAKDPNEVLCHG